MIPIAKPMIGVEEKNAVLDVMDSGMLTQGKKVYEFEKKYAEYIGTRYAVATSNGTTALYLALVAAGIGDGDEVITTPFTFVSTVTSILFCGAKPVLVDINPETFNIESELIESKVTDKTKAILPVHLYGQACDMHRIMKIADEYNLTVIEDACQAHGAEYKGKKVGSIGDIGCFSFYPTKNMTTGEGGIITTNNKEIADKIRMLRSHGENGRYNYVSMGYNFRMTDIAAAIGIEQLKKLNKFNEQRIKNAELLSEKLVEHVDIPYIFPENKHVFHQYTIKTRIREKVKSALIKANIGFGIYYPYPLHFYDFLKEYGNENLTNAERICNEVISLPVHPGISNSDIEKITETVNSVF